MGENFISVKEFAKQEGVSTQAVRKAIAERRIFAEKVGFSWIVGKGQTLKQEKQDKYDSFANRYKG